MKVILKSKYSFIDITGLPVDMPNPIMATALFEESKNRVIIIAENEDNVLCNISKPLFYELVKKNLIRIGEEYVSLRDYAE